MQKGAKLARRKKSFNEGDFITQTAVLVHFTLGERGTSRSRRVWSQTDFLTIMNSLMHAMSVVYFRQFQIFD